MLPFVRYPEHEEQVGALAREMGFASVSLSSDVMPMIRIVPRGFTGVYRRQHFTHR
jgi:N-methylhydantoinase A/oxoprolinase/acetone carboxylase beta subunit